MIGPVSISRIQHCILEIFYPPSSGRRRTIYLSCPKPQAHALLIWGAVAFSFLMVAPFGFSDPRHSPQISNRIRLEDNSDWWSESRTLSSDPRLRIQKREPAVANFQILGIDLGFDMLSSAATRLGKTTIVERGDAATGRAQICYVSTEDSGKVHLIFEQDEVGFTLYLFAEGPDWRGSDRCKPSNLISRNLSTASGLHLGQSPSQVMAILGRPSKQGKNELVYSFLVTKKMPPEELKQIRKQHPEMSEDAFHKSFDYYDLSAGVDARFTDSKLTYLALSKAELN